MKDSRSSRILTILAAVLIIVALLVSIALIILRVPDNRKFDEALLSSEIALKYGKSKQFKNELLKASRLALSEKQWSSILRIAAEGIPSKAVAEDYKLFTVLAGRAASRLPGLQKISAYWIWGLLRSGNLEKAGKHIGLLNENSWHSLIAEVKLKSAVGDSDDDVLAFVEKLGKKSDPEFLSSAAQLTGSAELTFDAALVYMMNGNLEKAYDSAQLLMNDERSWAETSAAGRDGVSTALAYIAYDAGFRDTAINWLKQGIKDSDRRRTTSWESLQFQGDLFWDEYLINGNPDDLKSAGIAWKKAKDIILSSESSSGEIELPSGSWRLWVNLSVQENVSGQSRESLKTLTEVLVLFPNNSEVKAAWARSQFEMEPALARRLIRNSNSDNPVLGITQIEIDPEAVTPRLYEARLWELFEDVTSGIEIQPADRRILTSFLLNYMSSRRNLSSVDVAIDRYLKVFPDEKWIYSWRLASDASRGMAIINMVSPQIDQMSPYENFRNLALSEKSWRAIHDSALFAIIASDEINELLKGFSINSDNEIQQEDEIGILDRAILNILKSYKTLPQIEKTPFADRIETLENNREDLFKSSFKSKFSLSGKKKMEMEQSQAFAVLRSTSLSLLENALNDLQGIDLEELNLSDENHADLLYLEAFLLKKENRLQESAAKANEVLSIISDHSGARDLLEQEVTL